MAEEQRHAIARWDPFRELGDLPSSRLGRLLDDVFGDRPQGVGLKSPVVDVSEDDDKYVISAEVPGVKRDDLTVECHEGVLSIRGEKKSSREETREKARLLERSYGAFSRSFSLPSDADADQLHATFKDGVLEIEIHKKAESKPRTVAIKS